MISLRAAQELDQIIPASLNNLLENANYAGQVLEYVSNAYSTDPRNAVKPSQEYVIGALEALTDHMQNVVNQINASLDLQHNIVDDTIKNAEIIDSV